MSLTCPCGVTMMLALLMSPSTRTRRYATPSEIKHFQAPMASRVTQLAVADALFVYLTLRSKDKTVSTRISDLELRLEHGTPSLLLKARTLPRKAGHDGIEGYSWPVLVVR